MKKIFTFFAALVCTVSMFAVQEKVYFVNAQNWSGTINAYAWAPQNANWPGVAATKEADQIAGYDVYSYSAEAGTYANVIFNNGSKQTPDLVWTAGKYYVRDGWYTKEDAAAKLGQPIEYESVYFVNVDGWANVKIYTWSPEVAGWPGEDMKKEATKLADKEVWSYAVEKGTTFGGMLFNDGNGKQTGDLKLEVGKYFVQDKWYTQEEALAKLNGSSTPENPNPETPVTGAYYVTGTAELVGADKAWDAAAIAMTFDEAAANHTHTFTGLVADLEYKLKVTNGTWEQSWGHAALSEVPAGVTADTDGNVVFTLAEAGDVVVTFNGTNITIAGNFKATGTPVTPQGTNYVLMGVGGDWTTGIALEANPENENEYMLLGQEIKEGDAVKVVTLTNGEATAWCGNVDEWSATHQFDKNGNIVLAPGIYDFYYKVAEDLIYIGAAGPVDPTPEPEYYEDVITNMQFDLEEMVIIGGPSEAFQVDVFLVLGEDDGSGQFQLTEESSVAVMGSDATFIDGIAYEIDAYAPAALVDLVVEWNGMLLQFHLTMSAAPMEATVVVVENATLEVEEIEVFDGMYEHAATLTGNWYNEADGLTYPVLVELPVYYPEATEPYEIMTTVTVGGWGDTDPWLGFGEGFLTVSIVDGVVTAAGIVENPGAGVAIDITITTGTLTPDVPADLAYVLMGVAGDWDTGIALEANPSNENEYMLLGQEIKEGDAVKVVTLTNGEATAWCGNVDEWSVAHEFDADGNIVLAPGTYDFYYKVAEDLIYIGAAGPVDPTPGEVSYVLMGVGGDWATGIALARNESALEEEYVLLNQTIAEGDAVKVVTLTDGVATAWCGNVDEASAVEYYLSEDYQNIVLAPGTYDFYYKVATDNIYIAVSTATGVDNIDVEKKAVKVIRDGQMFIIRDNVVYSVLGQVVK